MGCDMLVKLYNIPDDAVFATETALKSEGIYLKRAMAPDLHLIREFVEKNFSVGWADEATAGVLNHGCWLAVQEHEIVGFACFEATAKDFFGPIGVLPSMRGKNVGKALLLKSLLSMKNLGYAYAIIGWTGPQEFYRKVCGAVPIEDSIPGSYHGMVKVDWSL